MRPSSKFDVIDDDLQWWKATIVFYSSWHGTTTKSPKVAACLAIILTSLQLLNFSNKLHHEQWRKIQCKGVPFSFLFLDPEPWLGGIKHLTWKVRRSHRGKCCCLWSMTVLSLRFENGFILPSPPYLIPLKTILGLWILLRGGIWNIEGRRLPALLFFTVISVPIYRQSSMKRTS